MALRASAHLPSHAGYVNELVLQLHRLLETVQARDLPL